MDRTPGRVRRVPVPEQVDEPVDGHDPAHLDEQDGEEAPLLAPAADLEEPIVVAGLEWPEEAELHGMSQRNRPGRARRRAASRW